MTFEMIKKARPTLYIIFRIIVGFVFFSHGAQKLFGWFGATAVPTINLFWFAGLIEILVGLGIFFGVLTRLAAVVGLIEMIVAFFMAHIPSGIHPLINKGEPALLFIAAFLILVSYGAGRLSLERGLFKKELL